MKKIGWFFRRSNEEISTARMERIAGGIGGAIFILTTAAGMAAAQAQNPTPSNPLPQPEAPMSVPAGYAAHGSVDVGGRMANVTGGGAMYDTLVNLRSGPRVQGETFELHALPGNKHPYFDDLSAFSNGFGGDPNNFASLSISKGKYYEFDGTFTRDRQYFNYDLLNNPDIPSGQSIPIGTSGTSLAWPQVEASPVMFNTVRRRTNSNLTLLPESKVTYKFGYEQDIFQGPSLSPGESVGANNALLEQFERNSTDEFMGEIDWKPVRATQLTFAEEIDHYKENTYFTMAPSQYMVQEADGQPVALGDWNSYTPYTSSNCDSGAMGSASLLSASTTPGGKPVINPACNVVVSYLRSQPTRILYPTEIFRFQSTSIKNVAMNGDVRYTNANLNLPNYYEEFQGLDYVAPARGNPGYTINSMTFTGAASAKREVLAADYGIVWQANSKVSLSDQFDYSNVQEPGTANITAGATEIQSSATAPGYGTINYNGPLAPGPASTVEGSPNGTPTPDFFGQKLVTNDLTGTWDAWSHGMLSLTYRYRTNIVAEGTPHGAPLPVGEDGGVGSGGTVTIHQNGGILHIAMFPASNWNIDGSVEMLYADNSFTPVEPRQFWQYRVHTMYKPKQWATITGAYNDTEDHNNTNANAETGSTYYGPLDHVDYSRAVALGAVLQPPSKPYGLDLNYGYTDVYAATNICYDAGATSTMPGSAPAPGTVPNVPNVYSNGVCAGVSPHGSTALVDWYGRDFERAPTQYGSGALTLTLNKSLKSNIGYNINSVNGSRFFNDARQVNGSLVSTYQSPFVEVAWMVHPGLTWNATYNFYGYGEGGPSGPQYCSTSTSPTATPVLCTSLPYQTGLTISPAGETAPRNFHANNVTMGMHYQF